MEHPVKIDDAGVPPPFRKPPYGIPKVMDVCYDIHMICCSPLSANMSWVRPLESWFRGTMKIWHHQPETSLPNGSVYRICVYIHTCIYIYIHNHIHTLHYITLHYITLHYITLHYITLHYITLHYITLHYITLHYITLHYITYIH